MSDFGKRRGYGGADRYLCPVGPPGEDHHLQHLEPRTVQTGGRRNILNHERLFDIGLARQRLRWAPSVDLEEGLRKTIDYFNRILSLKTNLLQ